MAPFKLKFRMGNSRNNSQENGKDGNDAEVKEAFLHHNAANSSSMAASTSTIDSTDCHSLGSLGNTSERKLLLPGKTNNFRTGYLSQTHTITTTTVTTETNLLSNLSLPLHKLSMEEKQHSLTANKNGSHYGSDTTLLEPLILNKMTTCNDPNCPENCNLFSGTTDTETGTYDNDSSDNESQRHNSNGGSTNNCNCTMISLNDLDLEDRKESIDSQELLLSNTTTVTMTDNTNDTMQQNQTTCTDESCQQYRETVKAAAARVNAANDRFDDDGAQEHQTSHEFCDPLINCNDYYNESSNPYTTNDNQQMWSTEHDTCSDMSHCHQHHHHDLHMNEQDECQQQQSQYSAMSSCHSKSDYSMISTDITSNKSSKEIYKNLAKQCGITCKMSDGCRCMECQSHYFDCEFDENEHQKTDGGLGAGTPMFISEVMHGTACNVL